MFETMLADLVAQADRMPAEKRREWEQRLQFHYGPETGAGVVAGLAKAAEIAAEHSQEVGAVLRDAAAVAASWLIEQRKLYEEARRFDTPESRAAADAELQRILKGEVQTFPLDKVLRELGILKDEAAAVGDAPASKAS